jgi:protease-4
MKHSVFFNTLWACEEEYLSKMLAVLERKGEISKEELASMNYSNSSINAIYYFDAYTNVEGKSRKNGSPKYVAVIPVMGAMFKRAGWIEEASGLKGTEQLIKEIQNALADSSVVGILLHTDSPGGTVDGTETIANVVKNATKPVVCFADGMLCSAAYWVGAQAAEIWAAEKSSLIGSIGVLTKHINNAEYYKMNGREVTYITSSGSDKKIMGHDAKSLSEQDISYIKESLDATRQIFEDTVKAGRPAINNSAFDGGVYNADKALSMGMIDGICTFQDAVDRVVKLANGEGKSNTNSKASVQMGKSEAEVVREVMQAQLEEKKDFIAKLQEDYAKQTALLAEKEKQLASLQPLEEKVAKLEAENEQLKKQLETTPQNEGAKVTTTQSPSLEGVKRPVSKAFADEIRQQAEKQKKLKKLLS